MLRSVSLRPLSWLALFFIFATLSGCSTTNIIKRGDYIGEDTIKVGMERDRVLTYLGPPKEIFRYRDGRTKELFITRQGEKKNDKYLKAAGTAGLALVTLGLSEVATSPATVGDKHVSMTVWFTAKKRVEKTKIHKLEEHIF